MWVGPDCEASVSDWQDGGGWNTSFSGPSSGSWQHYNLSLYTAVYNGTTYSVDHDISWVSVS